MTIVMTMAEMDMGMKMVMINAAARQQYPPRKWFSVLLGAVISLAALGLVLTQVNLRTFVGHLHKADLRWLIGMTLFYVVVMVLRACRWQRLLNDSIPLERAFHILNISYLFNAILPLRLGEVARIILVGREPRQNAATALSALTLERLLDMLFALLCVGAGLILLPENSALPAHTSSTLGVVLLITLIGAIALASLKRTHALLLRLWRWMLLPVPAKWANQLATFAEDALNSLQGMAEPRRFARSLFWSGILWLGYLLYYQMGLYAFMPGSPSPGVALLVVGFISLGAAVPSLPGAIGIFQAAAILALTLNHYDASIAVSYAWGVWVPQTVLIIGIGALSLWATGLSFHHLTDDIHAKIDQPSAWSPVLEAEHSL